MAVTFRNELSTAADLNETSLEQALIDIAAFIDERGLKVAVQGTKLIIPKELQFTADRLLESTLRTATSDNDVNAIRNMGMLPEGYVVNHYLTDTDAFFIKTDAPNGFKMFERSPIRTSMEADFDTGNVRYKARERYSLDSRIQDVYSVLRERNQVNFKGTFAGVSHSTRQLFYYGQNKPQTLQRWLNRMY